MEDREEQFKEYDLKLRKVHELKKKKFTSSYTTRDIFYWILKNRLKLGVTLELFSHIIKSMNENVVEEICNGLTFYVPAGMGMMYINKGKAKIFKLPNGRYSSTACVDWNATKKLWYEDKEAEKAKVVIYFNSTNDPIYRFAYSRDGCKVRNLKYYVFRPHRRVKIKMKNIDNKDIIFEYHGKVHKYSTGNG